MKEKLPFALIVEGKWDCMSPRLKNKLVIYFQSKKSNGGECELDYQVSDGHRARVRFKSDEDEIPTSSTSQAKEVEVSEPSEDSKASSCTSAVIKNIQDLERDFLFMLVENVLRWNSKDQNFNLVLVPECDFAVVTFTNDKVLPKKLKWKNLEVSPLEMTTKVKVKDFFPDISLDCITLHFKKYGEVDVEMLEDDESAVITFKTHAEVNTVLATQHYIKKHPISVFPYCESLGVALYAKERPSLKLPESFTENIDQSVWKYFQEHQSLIDTIKVHMQAMVYRLKVFYKHGGKRPLMSSMQQCHNVVQNTVNKITQRIQRVKNSIEDEISMAPSLYEVIMNNGLQHKICSTFPELKLNYDAPGQKLTFWGIKQDILESKNTIYQEVVDLNRRPIALDASILHFLIMGNMEKLTKELFLSKGILASMEIKKDQALIVAKTEKTLQDGEDQLKAQLYSIRLDVDPGVLLSTEWKQLVNTLNHLVNSPIMTMLINQSDRQVVISGFSASVLLVQEQLNNHIQNYNHITTTLQTEKIVVKFMKEHKKSDWCGIGRNNVKLSFGNDTVSLSGPQLQVSKCKVVLQNLLSSVSCCRFEVDKPGARKVFKNKEMFIVENIKNKMGCVVELIEELDPKQISSSIIGKKRAPTPDEVEIIASDKDFCFYHVDAIVNVANDVLKLNSGLSKVLSDAAGPQLQEACNQIIENRTQLHGGEAVITTAGHLPCTHVIHAVVPHYDGLNCQYAVSVLENAVENSLNLAEREICQSLAILAVGFSSFGFPPGLCVDTIVSALNKFFQLMNGNTCLKKVYLIGSEKIIEAFETAVQKVLGGSCKKQDSTYPNSSGSQQTNPKHPSSSNQASSQSVKTNEGLTITLGKCNIQDTSLDVVVNSITSDLALNRGAVAQAILAAAGPQIQTLLNQQATGPVNTGGIFVTNGCNLKNKLVFHVVAPHWNDGPGSAQTHLESIVDRCLDLAEQHKQGSIVFPAIGTGNLGFPKNLVLHIMLDSILKFSKNRASHHVQEVMIAVHPGNHSTIQVFTDEFNKKFQALSSLASGSSPFSKVTSPKKDIYETSMGGVVLQVLTGDITKETTDVIVNSTNKYFTLKSGVSKAVLDGAGPDVEAEYLKLGALPNKGLIMTQHGNLQCKKIIHVSATNDPKTIQKRVNQALEMCAKNKFTSISFPAFETDHMLDGVIDFLKQTPQSLLQTVRIVIFQAAMLVDFYQSMMRREANEEQKTGDTCSRHSAVTKSLLIRFKPKNKKPQQEADCFTICGPSQSAIDETKQFLNEVISEEQASQLIKDAMILKLSDKDKQRIRELQKNMQVNLKLERKGQASAKADSDEVMIIVEGLSKDVLVVAGEINAMLKATRDVEKTAELVDWQYQQDSQFHSFDLATNLQLEGAFNRKAQQVDINYQTHVHSQNARGSCSIDDLPKKWDVMESNELHKVCLLQTNSKEYNDVLAHFRKTCYHSVHKIERIQNPCMWKNYQNNKQFMEQKNGHQNNEKLLFHGTREESISQINENGFNRSYAGKNAASYGKGTYFALHASYSAKKQYSVQNSEGIKHMYFCRVLTGDYTLGNSAMILPPAKTANSVDFYDTVVDNTESPTIFVVFRDYHAYPDYLITFS
ncbi:Poly [ADP-ribose] polymerase 14 [Bagarius yarrelli]|uniref:Poly [ADP-ribose] polymerase n=1 Tax=Bagarius yarrelli TaxID=175774 RepID=A0A556U4J3_BAGYA|nr:Poly [ADP-ribose] polymerase 14 [Bagarius yarrelli]